jgi:hypothetical protein
MNYIKIRALALHLKHFAWTLTQAPLTYGYHLGDIIISSQHLTRQLIGHLE